MRYEDLTESLRHQIADKVIAIDHSLIVIMTLEEGFDTDGYFVLLYAIEAGKPLVLIHCDSAVAVPQEFHDYQGQKLLIDSDESSILKLWLANQGLLRMPVILEAEYERPGVRLLNDDLE